jgi:hypothetical protein
MTFERRRGMKVDFELKNLSVSVLKADALPGSEVYRTTREALILALCKDSCVEFSFNGRPIKVSAREVVHGIVDEQYNSTFKSDET